MRPCAVVALHNGKRRRTDAHQVTRRRVHRRRMFQPLVPSEQTDNRTTQVRVGSWSNMQLRTHEQRSREVTLGHASQRRSFCCEIYSTRRGSRLSQQWNGKRIHEWSRFRLHSCTSDAPRIARCLAVCALATPEIHSTRQRTCFDSKFSTIWRCVWRLYERQHRTQATSRDVGGAVVICCVLYRFGLSQYAYNWVLLCLE
jgi:hypothetical protein